MRATRMILLCRFWYRPYCPLGPQANHSAGRNHRRTPGMPEDRGPLGSNYVPADAINQLEMWQTATFDPQRIDTELGWAEGLGMNTMRVFLHDLLWQEDAAGFRKRIDLFLRIADKHHIHPIFVLFDSCWEEVPNSVRSILQSPERTIRAGCKYRCARLKILRSTHACRTTCGAWWAPSPKINASWHGTSGTSRRVRPRRRAPTSGVCVGRAGIPRNR